MESLLVTLACIGGAVLGYAIGWFNKHKPVKYSAPPSYFHQRPTW